MILFDHSLRFLVKSRKFLRNQKMVSHKISPLQVHILTNDVKHLNKNYVRIFTTEPGFADPIFSGIKYPDEEWIDRFCKSMSMAEVVELYNHYLIWTEAVNKNEPQVILYNRSYPTQSDIIISELIKAGGMVKDKDIVFYGKYLDRCDRYKYNRTVVISDNSSAAEFSLYQTFSPYGAYAYLINPSGAATLINELDRKPLQVEAMINNLLECGFLEGVTYHPSIIRLPNDPCNPYDECRDPDEYYWCPNWGIFFWYIIIFLLLGLILGAIIYLLAINFSYNLEQEISTGYETVALKLSS